MTNAKLLQRNLELCKRCARQLRREILARLDYGDTMRVGPQLAALAGAAYLPNEAKLLAFLASCDGEEAFWFFQHGCATDALSTSLEIVSGKNCLGWLAILDNKGTWDMCPPLHPRGSQLSITP